MYIALRKLLTFLHANLELFDNLYVCLKTTGRANYSLDLNISKKVPLFDGPKYKQILTNLPYLLPYSMLLCQIYIYINSTFVRHLQ